MERWVGEALVLRVVDYGESDRIVHLLTAERGRVTVIAKGARRSRRRFPGTLDLFNHLRVALSRRRRTGMSLLDQAVLRSPFLGLRASGARYAMASYLLELIGRMAPEEGAGDEVARLFDFALASQRLLDARTPDLRLRLLLELRALDALGLRPELRQCVRCGKPVSPPVGFHVADGGVICGGCARPGAEPVLPVQLGTLRVLAQGLEYDVGHLGRLAMGQVALAEAGQLLFRFHRFHVGLELRSERFLDQILHRPALRGPA